MMREDIDPVVDYFLDADAKFLEGMGAEKSKLPNRSDWVKKLNLEFENFELEKLGS